MSRAAGAHWPFCRVMMWSVSVHSLYPTPLAATPQA
jgi:hypothetical protein